MPDLYLRKVDHHQARDNYRVILKLDGAEFEIGSIGLMTFTSSDTAWTWGIDTVLPCATMNPKGAGPIGATAWPGSDLLGNCTAKSRAGWMSFWQ